MITAWRHLSHWMNPLLSSWTWADLLIRCCSFLGFNATSLRLQFNTWFSWDVSKDREEWHDIKWLFKDPRDAFGDKMQLIASCVLRKHLGSSELDCEGPWPTTVATKAARYLSSTLAKPNPPCLTVRVACSHLQSWIDRWPKNILLSCALAADWRYLGQIERER